MEIWVYNVLPRRVNTFHDDSRNALRAVLRWNKNPSRMLFDHCYVVWFEDTVDVTARDLWKLVHDCWYKYVVFAVLVCLIFFLLLCLTYSIRLKNWLNGSEVTDFVCEFWKSNVIEKKLRLFLNFCWRFFCLFYWMMISL